jgi:hypothetical protein
LGCPGNLIVTTYDIAQILRNAGMTVISGFHSPMERARVELILMVIEIVGAKRWKWKGWEFAEA